MNADQMADCFNEWMRRYIEEPDRFEREFRLVNAFVAAELSGQEPSYGRACAQYMQDIAKNMGPTGHATAPQPPFSA